MMKKYKKLLIKHENMWITWGKDVENPVNNIGIKYNIYPQNVNNFVESVD